MKKSILLLCLTLLTGITAMAQKSSTKVIDNKGTIKWVIDSSTAVITKGDSTLLYVTPTQLNDSMMAVINNIDTNFLNYSDTAAMLAPYLRDAGNGLTKNGQVVELGGTLSKVTTIATTATEFLAITGLQPGSSTTDSLMVVDPSGQVKFISASTLFNALTFSNGLTKTGNTVELGGALTKGTTISTAGNNLTIGVGGSTADSLNITGLPSGSLATDSIVVVNGTSGKIGRVTATSLLQSGVTNITAAAGQSTYNVVNMPGTASKVWVYRNGAKLLVTDDYTVAPGTVTLTTAMAALIASGDIIEVQWVK